MHCNYFEPWKHRPNSNLILTWYLFEKFLIYLRITQLNTVGRDSSVGVATAYGLDGPRIESRWGRDFPHQSRPSLRPTQPPVQWVPGLSPGVRCGRGVTLTPHPLLMPRSKIEYSYTSTLPKGLRGLKKWVKPTNWIPHVASSGSLVVINKLEIMFKSVDTAIIYFPDQHSPKHSEKN